MPRYTPATGILSFKRRGDDALAGVLLDPGGAPKDWGGSHTGAQLRVLVLPTEPFPRPDGYVPVPSAGDPLDAMAVAVVEAQGEARAALTELRRRQVQVADLQTRVIELQEKLDQERRPEIARGVAVRVTRDLELDAGGDHPRMVVAEKGTLGVVVQGSDGRYGWAYLVRLRTTAPNRPLEEVGVNRDEVEALTMEELVESGMIGDAPFPNDGSAR